MEGAMLYYGEHMNECAAQLQAAGSEEEDGRRVGGREHSYKVAGSTVSRNGVERRGLSFYKIVVRKGYTSMER